MKGDFSRFTFLARKHFTRVLKQQGRVELDADWNEDEAIQAHLRETALADIIGVAGAPGDGFLISTPDNGATFQAAAGRFYVNGVMVETDAAVSIAAQPYGSLDADQMQPPDVSGAGLPPLPFDNLAGGTRLRTDLVFLDVWEQHITALEDAAIREVALGGPDTATRLQARWRLRWRANVNALTCDDAISAFPPAPLGTGRLTTSDNPGTPDSDPCIVEPDRGGYRGLENRLYRVEIHRGGNSAQAQFKWSSENGAVVYAVEEVTGARRLKVRREGRDALLRLNAGQAVEIYSAEDVRLGRSGILTTIDGAPNDLEINVVADISAYQPTVADPAPVIYIRRWDEVARAVSAGGALGDSGIDVAFSSGTYRVGDYWTFAARARTGSFEPVIDQPPHGIAHHHARVALVHWWRVIVGGNPTLRVTIEDCRPVFPPLTSLIQLHYVSGDGQETLPGSPLPRPLVVRVSNGGLPVKGAPVRFVAEAGTLTGGAGSATDRIVMTDNQGFASVQWTPSAAIHSQQVVASLFSDPQLQARFNANLSTADRVAYTPADDCDMQVTNVQDALDELCRRRAAAEPGIRVTGIFWENALIDAAGNLLRGPAVNDAFVSADNFLRGLAITLDQDIDPVTISRATCTLTLEMPGMQLVQMGGYLPVALRPEKGFPAANANEILWRPDRAVRALLRQAFTAAARYGEESLLVRLMVQGNFIYDRERRLYLDGDAFGFKEKPPHDLRPLGPDGKFYSGDERVGGDFEMWFWVTRGDLQPEEDRIGFAVLRALDFAFYHEVLSLATPREEIQASGLLPPGIQVDPSIPFDIDEARRLLRARRLSRLPFTTPSLPNLLRTIAYSEAVAPVVQELIQPQWSAVVVDAVVYEGFGDDDFLSQVGDVEYAGIICLRSQFEALLERGVTGYEPDSFTLL
jgi:hypothetical protein